MYELKPRAEWTLSDELDVAYLIVTPETNGGMDAGVDLLDVAGNLPADLPAWAVWVDGLIAFLIGLIPFDGEKGFAHFAMTGALSRADSMTVARAFLDSLPGIQVYALTDRPSLVPILKRLGFGYLREEMGQHILQRASRRAAPQHHAGMNTATLTETGGDSRSRL